MPVDIFFMTTISIEVTMKMENVEKIFLYFLVKWLAVILFHEWVGSQVDKHISFSFKPNR